jgi:4-amino-4-deoxy-L-arabinose transferase-like glycosyltransferase
MKIASYYPYSHIFHKYILSVEHIALLGITITGIFLRLPLLLTGIWRDEAATFFDVQGDTIAQVLHNIAIYEFTPPGFFLMMMPWFRLVGNGEVVAKLPVFFLGIGLIFANYRLGRMVSSKKVGLLTAAVTACSQPAVFFSQEMRAYMPAALLTCLCMALYCRLLRHGRQWDWVAFILAMTGLLYFHTPGCIFAIGLGIITLGLWRKDCLGKGQLTIQKFVIAGIAIVGLYSPWLKVLLGQIAGGFNYGGGAPWGRSLEFYERPIRVVLNLIYAISPGLPVTLGLFSLLTATIWVLKNRPLPKPKKPPLFPWNLELTILSASVFLVAALEGALSMGGRYIFFMMPIASVILAHCLVGSAAILGDYFGNSLAQQHRLKQTIIGGFICLLFASSLVHTIGYVGVDKTSVRPFMRDLQQGVYPGSPKDTVYLEVPDVLGITVGYYQKFQTPPDSELAQAQFHGFPVWQNPELHQPNGYYRAWQNLDISVTLGNIDREHQQGKRYLGLLYSDSVSHWLQPQYLAKVDALIKALRQKYPMIQQKDYVAKKSRHYYLDEEFTFYLFDLESPQS